MESVTQFFARLKAEPPAGSLPPPLHQAADDSSSLGQPQPKVQKRGKAAPAANVSDGLVTASQPTLMSAWAQPVHGGNKLTLQVQASTKRHQWQAAMSAAASASAAGRVGQTAPGVSSKSLLGEAVAPGGLVHFDGASAEIGLAAGQFQPATSAAMGSGLQPSVELQSAPHGVFMPQHGEAVPAPGVSHLLGTPMEQMQHQIPVPLPRSCPHSAGKPRHQGESHVQQRLVSPAGQQQLQLQQQQPPIGSVVSHGQIHQLSGAGMPAHQSLPVTAAMQHPGHQYGPRAGVGVAQHTHQLQQPTLAGTAAAASSACGVGHQSGQHHHSQQAQHAQQVQQGQHAQRSQHVQRAQQAQHAQRAQQGGACGVSAAMLQDWVAADMQTFVAWVSTHDFMQVLYLQSYLIRCWG